MIKSKQLARALFELSEKKIENLDAKFFDFIEKRNLQAQLPSVLYHFEKIIEQDREKKGIQIEVAHEIKNDTVNGIKKYLKAENLPEVVKIKKELIGGFRAKWNGVIYDSSILTGLKKLEKNITN
ncbi:MAG TPA: F0F1 ATP synthase subunit delta [Candidatus Paceibacterota bacterium]|mgnify:CR=1 FL=1|nr:F0F1 ATP synthase subunit delta [Candidatus Paceibacterota bacterium]HPT18136.1 F0F1 ATP synthase subunit delta [Candidatus Paceibacterota bacterium]